MQLTFISLFFIHNIQTYKHKNMEIKINKPNSGNDDSVVIQGNTHDGVHSFLGVPYAQPPVGNLRWKAPVLRSLYDFDTLDATKFGHVSIQTIPVFNPNGLGEGITEDEDCLNLNIWTTDTTTKNKPVLVWIHGGGYCVWSSSLKVTDGETLAREDDVVVVTVNYRLGALGFMHTNAYKDKKQQDDSSDVHCNFGLLDWVTALEWVSKHIHHFGGDANNVSVMGQSAGGAAVYTLLSTPRAEGLFHKIILLSKGGDDYAYNVIPPDDNRLYEQSRRFCDFLIEEEVNEESDVQELLAKVPIDKIKQNLMNFFSIPATEENGGPLCGFTQMIYGAFPDGKIFTHEYTPWAKSNVKFLIGATEYEGRFFVKPWGNFQFPDPATIYTKETLAIMTKTFTGVKDDAHLNEFFKLDEKEDTPNTYFEAIDDLLSTVVFHEPVYALAQKLTSLSIPVYVYMFTRVCPGAKKTNELSYHCVDIPYFFGTLHKRRTLKDLILTDNQEEEGYFDDIDVQLSKEIRHGAFKTFAHTGVPSSSYGEWPKASKDMHVALISDEITSAPFPKSHLFNYVHSLRPSV
jgi:para-nitrobenzyl esterase